MNEQKRNKQASNIMRATKCSHSHGGWTTKTVIWNMKKFLHVIFVYLSAASIMNSGWK